MFFTRTIDFSDFFFIECIGFTGTLGLLLMGGVLVSKSEKL
jgi:hypothetical protein